MSSGIAFIDATFNNTTVTITDQRGDTPVGRVAARAVLKEAERAPHLLDKWQHSRRLKSIKVWRKGLEVRVKGPGSGRESAITALQAAGMNVKSIEDITPFHNGCRPPKKRRV